MLEPRGILRRETAKYLERVYCGQVDRGWGGSRSAIVSNASAASEGERSLFRQTVKIQWSEIHQLAALISTIAVAGCVMSRLVAGSGQIGMAAATGAYRLDLARFSGYRGSACVLRPCCSPQSAWRLAASWARC